MTAFWLQFTIMIVILAYAALVVLLDLWNKE